MNLLAALRGRRRRWRWLYSSRSKIRCERSHSSIAGFFTFGSMILNVYASATLIPPATSSSRASVSSL